MLEANLRPYGCHYFKYFAVMLRISDQADRYQPSKQTSSKKCLRIFPHLSLTDARELDFELITNCFTNLEQIVT